MVKYVNVCPCCGSENYIEKDGLGFKCEDCGVIFVEFDQVEDFDLDHDEDFDSDQVEDFDLDHDEYFDSDQVEDFESNEFEDFESNEGMLDNLDDEQNLFNEFAYDDEGFDSGFD